MSTLTLDIKPNDALERSAIETAKALDKVAAAEKTVNALTAKGAASYRTSAVNAAALAKYTEVYGKSAEKAAKAEDKRDKKKKPKADKEGVKIAKKENDEHKKKPGLIDKAAAATLKVGAAFSAAAAAATAMGAAIALSAKHASESKASALALMNAWTHGRGEEVLKRVDAFANKVGMSTEEAREKFVEYRKTSRWVTNQAAADLIKLRADLIAVGKSSELADEEISSIMSHADNPAMFAAKLAEVKRAYGGVGSGALAAANALQSVDAAQNRISNAFSETMSDLWKEIGPAIGKAANRLADFVTEALKSEEGQAAIKGVAEAFKSVSEAINKENITTALNVIKATAVAVSTVVEGMATALGAVGSVIGKGVAFLRGGGKQEEAYNANEIAIAEKRAEIMGRSVSDGIASGIASGEVNASNAAVSIADQTSADFAKALGIQSPSKVFEDFGRQTVRGFTKGEEQELGTAMPLQSAAAVPIQSQQGGSSESRGAPSITIENINVSGKDADEIARSIRQELQLLLQAGQLARGFA